MSAEEKEKVDAQAIGGYLEGALTMAPLAQFGAGVNHMSRFKLNYGTGLFGEEGLMLGYVFEYLETLIAVTANERG